MYFIYAYYSILEIPLKRIILLGIISTTTHKKQPHILTTKIGLKRKIVNELLDS